MTLQYIRDYYGVPAKRGSRIKFAGSVATIVGTSGPHLRARMEEPNRYAAAGQIVQLHPTWKVEYLTAGEL